MVTHREVRNDIHSMLGKLSMPVGTASLHIYAELHVLPVKQENGAVLLDGYNLRLVSIWPILDLLPFLPRWWTHAKSRWPRQLSTRT
jgi:hypothetical protein